jgi:hypothetical protein
MCDELYCRKLILLVMKHIVFACHKSVYFLTILEAPRPGRQPKHAMVKKIIFVG